MPQPDPMPSTLLIVDSCGGGFASISAALAVAGPGDVVRVRGGIYRETVRPHRGGTRESPITIEAAPGEIVHVRGSVAFNGPWMETGRTGVVRADISAIPDAVAAFSEVARSIPGRRRRGHVFIDGAPLTEVDEEADVRARPGSWRAGDDGATVLIHYPAGVHPTHALVEFAVRDRVLAPAVRGLGWLVIRGITFSQAANRSAGGFWESGGTQMGLVSCRSGHHWLIEDCVIRHAKTLGMDVGAEGQGDQEGSALPFSEVGHHCIRRNTISDNGECGLTGAGHTGTRVIGNIVERNNALGHRSVEEAGIKFHFCYDGVISGNLLRDNHGCGIWLDNEWYGTRVTGNVVCGSTGSGIFVEMGTGSCLVDNNIVAYTRAGDGIYTHDTSGVVIAHNLLIANAHFGVYLRYVTERMHRASDGATTMVGCSDNLVINNVMVDNYRGHVCLPGTSARSQRNRSDWNLFIGGTQWQWEALRFDVFALNGNDGRIPPDMLASLAGGAVPPFAIGLDQWRSATGNDISSMAPQVHHGPVENGAVRKGACGLAPNGVVTVCIDNPSSFTLLACPRVPRIDSDIFGVARPSGAVLPGPFAVLGKDAQVLPLWPLPPSGCEANGSAFALDP